MKSRAIALATVILFALGCVQQGAPIEPAKEKTPRRIESATPPVLEPTEVEGIQRGVLEGVRDLYYLEADERWYRYALETWFVAFAWDGSWFPMSEAEIPTVLAQFEPTGEERRERQLTREEELREIEEKLRAMEREERGGQTRDEELADIEEQLRALDEKEGDEE